MQTLIADVPAAAAPAWLRAASLFGVVWNVYGLYQFAGTFTEAGQASMTAGMTPAQAAIYLALPAWISVAFFVGVAGGLLGSIALALRRSIAVKVLAGSLIGYLVLFAGDAYHGVFAGAPGQLAVLTAVVLIAGGLLWAARIANRRQLLRA